MRRIITLAIVSLIGLEARSENFSCTVHDAVITGTDSTLVCHMDGEDMVMDLPEGTRLRGIDAFGDGIIAIADGGTILFWDSPFDKARRRHLDTKGELTDIDAGADVCYAVTDSSEIVSIDQALQGKVFDFNSNYSEYYGKVHIIGIATGPAAVFIAARREDGRPAAFTSTRGTVWSERDLDYSVNGVWHIFEKVPHGIAYEELSESFVLLCEDGVEFHLPACSHCNYVTDPSTLQ